MLSTRRLLSQAPACIGQSLTTARLASVGTCLCPLILLLLCAAAAHCCCGALLRCNAAMHCCCCALSNAPGRNRQLLEHSCARIRLRPPGTTAITARLAEAGGGNCWCGELLLQRPPDTHTYASRGRSVTAAYICVCIAVRALYHTDPGHPHSHARQWGSSCCCCCCLGMPHTYKFPHGLTRTLGLLHAQIMRPTCGSIICINMCNLSQPVTQRCIEDDPANKHMQFEPVSCIPCHKRGLSGTIAASLAVRAECTSAWLLKWKDIVRKQASTIRLSSSATSVQTAMLPANTFVLTTDGFHVLRPTAGGKHGPKWNQSCGRAPMRFEVSRQLPFFFMLRELSERGWVLPESMFTIHSADVPGFLGNSHVPTLTFEGYMTHSRQTVPIPTPHIAYRRFYQYNHSSFALTSSKQVDWNAKADTLIYSDGHAWRTLIDSDPFRSARITVRQLAKEHPSFISMRDKPIPFASWARHKYTLFLDGVGPSGRMPELLGLNSTIFIPDPAPNGLTWPMALLRPWSHYVPVLRNLSDLIDKIDWARQNDHKAKLIAFRAARLSAGMTKESMLCAIHESLEAVNMFQAGMRFRVRPGVDHVCPLSSSATYW